MSNNIDIVAHLHPFRSDCEQLEGRIGATLLELMTESGLDPVILSAPGVRLYVNDVAIARNLWPTFTPTAGQLVTVGVVPTGGDGGGKDVLRIVALIAVSVVAMYAAGPIATALGFAKDGIAASTIAATMTLGGALAINALIPPQTPKFEPNAAGNTQVYGISGMRNKIDPYGVPPVIYGKHRIYPPYAALPYTELVGEHDQYLRCLFDCGYAPVALSDFKIGETALASYDEVEYEIYLSDDYVDEPDTAGLYTIFPNSVTENPTNLPAELTADGTTVTRTTSVDTD